MDRPDTITLKTSSLYQLAYISIVSILFLHFSHKMMFGPCEVSIQGVTVTEDLQVKFFDYKGNVYLQGVSHFSLREDESISYCGNQQNSAGSGCLEHEHNQQFKVVTDESGKEGVQCHQVRHEGLRCSNQVVKDCYSLVGQHWYGGFEAVSQMWPLKANSLTPGNVLVTTGDDGVQLPFGPYISGDFGMHSSELENVLERLFISSSGVGIFVSAETPLYLSFNQHGDQLLCLAATYDNTHYISPLAVPPVLDYTVCKADNVKDIQMYMQSRFIPRPEGIPSRDIFRRPIWSTWAQYNKNVNESAVMDLADNLLKHKFPCSQIEIDDEWTSHYGDLSFDPVKFPNPKQMVGDLNKKGYAVTLWTHPFMSLDSDTFKEAFQNKYAVLSKGSEIPSLVKWWNGEMASMLDVTNPAAVLWYQKRLLHLQEEYNISSFKFDAGEARFVPHSHQTWGQMTSVNQYTQAWAELAYSADPVFRRQEVRAAWRSQHLPIFTRLMDRMSTWDKKAGLQSIIPSVLTFGVIGYPFVLPDMIGGNAYSDMVSFSGGAYPERELYLRWLQLNTFLPALQFSVVPWIYDKEVVTLTHKFLKLREKYIPNILKLAEESVQSGTPIIRPLWWVAPSDQEALRVGDQYMMGDDLLVAPVVVEGARKRDVYLPVGTWRDMLRKEQVTGPTWIRDYSVALEELAYFERI